METLNYVNLDRDKSEDYRGFNKPRELDDVQNVFTNANLKNYTDENHRNRSWFK